MLTTTPRRMPGIEQADATPTAFVFPGQGAQKVGMTKKELDIPAVQVMYAKAKDVLGYDIQKIVMGDSQEALDSTLAALERLRLDDPDAVKRCTAAAGLSLGEYTALVAGGAITFEDALKIVKIRGEMMLEASKQNKGTMLSVIGVDDATLAAACEEVAAATRQTAEISNFLSPGIRVISGDEEAVEMVRFRIESKAMKVQYLAVSGAFHTRLMQPAVDALRSALDHIDIRMPHINVYANTLGRPYEVLTVHTMQ
ncbi:hypothetical protein PTSG_02782 [Salpingoeca rosetta]|uniref:Malonyl-CoA:ACP transacylase (MAT) domain-containing protein n=1 Tax=Salpingoeca rosetta (strain ATCC 50818 / BSB-021) TaxID=946362 RepID=F2U3A8_SALR5|nr:uncharacterized protein PTSG_02782 [Salpingoeca rosetta]EGD82102.1 hypothetical protein PTSG_02782 [Salpingoeca rosetta]|eukprot:XP_004996285.1 hypothetical protein PTSG_02782 [Salpingoeca rosetta]